MEQRLNTYWGDAHHNLYVYPDGGSVDMEAVCREARKHLDFFPMAYYTPLSEAFHPERNAPGKAGIRLERWKDADLIEKEWAEIQAASRAFNEDDSFVTFPGYEWQGDGTDGDHNVIHREEGTPVGRVDRLADLYEYLRGREAFTIYMCVSGSAQIRLGSHRADLERGQTLLIPAAAGGVRLETPGCEILEVTL